MEYLKENCTISSEKKSVTKNGPKMTLNAEMERLFRSFKASQPNMKISRSFFFIIAGKSTSNW